MDALDPPVPMQITVTTLERRTIPLDVAHSHMTEAVKAMIEEKEGIPANRQRLLLNQELLENGWTLQRSGVEDGAIISLVLRLAGAEPEPEPDFEPEPEPDFEPEPEPEPRIPEGVPR